MGNVSSADHDKVNELLTRRAKKKTTPSSERKLQKQLLQQQQHQQQLQQASPPNTNGLQRQKSSKGAQADFYSKANDYSPLTPTSPLPTTSSFTAAARHPYDPIPYPTQQPGAPAPRHSAPIVIPQRSTLSSHPDSDRSSAPPSPFPPVRRGSEQQTRQLPADPLLLGTSPEAKDWLRQKPTRSSHMIHQYNFQSHQYYQTPGSVKVVNNTCRNMTGYANVPTLPRIDTAQTAAKEKSGSNPPAPQKTKGPRPSSITAAAAALTQLQLDESSGTLPSESPSMVGANGAQVHKESASAATVEAAAADDHEPVAPINVHSNRVKEPRVGRLVMSQSKLNSPSVSSLSSVSSRHSFGTTPDSPLESLAHSPAVTKEETLSSTLSSSSSGPATRPSSTLSSLRSLLGNHPQGLSLIESLEEEDEDDLDSLSDTETGDSDADLIHRTQLLSSPADGASEGAHADQSSRPSRRRPPPQFEWMEARRRFSSSDLSAIGRNVSDSQKGQHALWKYIGGGNAHAPLRYDIDRILDSGCGLGEWAMEMAKEFPNATIYGVDINPELFPTARQPVPSNCLFTQSNVLNRLSFPDQYFDYVYQRFMYLGLTVDDWPVALKELRRVMKPNGWIELFEPCMRVHRAGQRTKEVMRWISRLLQEERGLDFDFAGEKMKRLCESPEIGFHNVRLERLSIPVGRWGGRVGEAMAENMVLMFHNLQSALLEQGSSRDVQSQKAFEGMVQSWIRECEENKSYIDYYILVAQRMP